jgi:CBS domain-containing protein
MQLREIMKREVISILPDSPVSEAARKMVEHNIGCLPVIKDGAIKGILTDRDIVLKVIAKGGDPSLTWASDVMQSHVITAGPDMDLSEALHLMSFNRIRRLPIQENGRVVGIVSIMDLGHVVKEEVDELLSLQAIPAHH